MDVRDLEVFLSVAKYLNFTRAGDEVHLSQPSISVRVRKLEEELNVKLFEQLGKRVALTEAGQLLVPYARRVVAALDDARHAVEELQGLERGTLRIGASTTPGMYLVPKLIARFKRRYPKVEVRLEIKDTRQVEEGLIRNEYDFGFVGGHLVGGEMETLPWRNDEVVLIVPPDHTLARKRLVRVDDLARQQFILRERGSATRAAVNEKLSELSLQLETVMEMDNPEAVKNAVQGGMGVAFLSRFAVETELKAGTLTAVKVRGLSVSRELKIVYRRDKHLSRAARAFVEMALAAGG
ncbi:MAG TPA: selenium metabolism-associated LysR family transcriptional regulator [Pyrinomonadaceae bacterium]